VTIKDSLSGFQGFFVGLGFGADKAREMSQQMQALAIDFASFNNLSDEEAVGRFISALSGSSEVLQKFGINTKQAALEEELLSQGVKKSWTEVTEQEKAVARLSVIMKAMTSQGAVGDAVKTAGSFANLLKALRSAVYDASVAIGDSLIPVLTPFLQATVGIARATVDWIKQNGKLFAIVGGVGVVTLALGATITGVGLSLTAFGIALGAIASVLGAVLSPLGAVVAGLVLVSTWFATSTDFGRKMVQSLAGWFGDLRDIAVDAFGGIVDAFAAGDLVAAGEIAWTGLKALWLQGTNTLRTQWRDLSFKIIDIFTETVNGVKVLWNELVTFVDRAAIKAGAQIQKAALELQGFIPALFASGERFDEMEKQLKAQLKAIDLLTDLALRGLDITHDKKMDDLAEERKAEIAAISDAKTESEKVANDALEKAKAELKALREKTAEERKQRGLGKGPNFEPGALNLGGGAIKNQIFGTFSAAALAAAGGTGGASPAKEMRERRREAREQHMQLLRFLRATGGRFVK
jgi:hypothetical protein